MINNYLLDIYIKEIKKYKLLKNDEITFLFKLKREGDIYAREKLINSNLGLAIFIAKKYINKNIPFEDLIQEANIGLIEAIDRFDETLGNKFSSYAVWWIKRYILHYIYTKLSFISLPEYFMISAFKLLRISNYNIKDNSIYKNIIEIANENKITKEKALFIIDKINMETLSINDNNNLLESAKNNDEYDKIYYNELLNKVLNTISNINDRDKNIFLEYIGFAISKNENNKAAIGRKYNLSREHVRKIVNKIKNKIRRKCVILGIYNEIKDIISN